MRQLSAYQKSWPVAGSFTISRSSLTQIPTIWVEISDGEYVGRAECRPYARYGDTVQSVLAEIDAQKSAIETGLSQVDLNKTMPPGPARNALDCALWDLKAKQSGKTVSTLLNLPSPKPRITAYTLSLQTAQKMAEAAKEADQYPLLKIKIDQKEGINCVKAILTTRPDAKLIIDANESLDHEHLSALIASIPHDAIAMMEQPIHANVVDKAKLPTDVIVCADESLHSHKDITKADLERLWEIGFRAINIKLDKCGGLTTGLHLARLAKSMNFQIMAGCMVGSSLAMAPMMILESFADVIDLDGPLLLSDDCDCPLIYQKAKIHPPQRQLWG